MCMSYENNKGTHINICNHKYGLEHCMEENNETTSN
jgi:hypothetical protein